MGLLCENVDFADGLFAALNVHPPVKATSQLGPGGGDLLAEPLYWLPDGEDALVHAHQHRGQLHEVRVVLVDQLDHARPQHLATKGQGEYTTDTTNKSA